MTYHDLTRPPAAGAAPGRGRVPVPGGRGWGRGARPVRPCQPYRQLRARAALHSAGRTTIPDMEAVFDGVWQMLILALDI